ncbi:MAG: copper chaperone PCu(A)C [Chloroflexi bacterium]|nr:copper chaperone PCu(A)C [Chloroflexota bacterium]
MRNTVVLNNLPFPSLLDAPRQTGGNYGGNQGSGDGVERQLPTLLIILLLAAACRQQAITPADILMELTTTNTLIGETTLLLAVTDSDGNAIADPGALKVRGDMSHAGMVPVFAEADQSTNGIFSLPFTWTMAGGWIVEASLTLPNGELASETFRFEILSESDEDEMTGVDHSAMEHSAGETSAVYLRIRNRGAADQVIVAAESAAAEQVAFHRTVVENDIARMEAIDALVIPAGETLELRPGGTHIMLSGLSQDLTPESTFSLQLKCESGEVYDLDIHIADMLMSERDDAISFGDLTFSNRWARPAKAGGMTHADMPMNSHADHSSG